MAFTLLVASPRVLAEPTRRVLILNSYHKEFQWTDQQVLAAEEVLSAALDDLELYVEYMDTKRIFNESYLDLLRETYRLKYANVELDAIIATDDNALNFLLEHNERLFGNSPVVFCGINDFTPARLQGHDNYTGLVEVLDIKEALDLALRLHPGTRRVAVVVDDTPTGMGQRKSVASIAKEYGDLEFEFLKGEDLTNDDLAVALGSLPTDSIVLLTVWLRDKDGVYLPTHEGGRLISSSASVPVYGIIDMFLGHGIVGGKLLNSATHGRTAAEMVLRILDGTVPAEIPVRQDSTNPYMFDHRQLTRWGIDASALPEDSIVIHRPVSFYSMYRHVIWSVVAAFVLLIALVIVLTRNVLQRKRAEARYRNLVEATSDWVWAVDREARFTYSNDRVRDFLGYEPAEILGKTPFDFMDAEERRRMEAFYEELLVSRAPIEHLGHNYLHKNGVTIVLETNGVPILDSTGHLVGYRGIDRDITERKIAEEERDRLVEELEAKNTELEHFSYTVSHDLKSPLVTINGFLGLLKQDLAAGNDSEIDKSMVRIATATQQMQDLLDGILELSRIGRVVNPPTHVALSDLVTETLALLAGGITEKGIEVEVCPDLPTLYGDHLRLREALQNLVENAVKHMGDEPNPHIVIGGKCQEGETLCFVQDNGRGIKSRDRDRIFEIFQKLDRRGEGIGVGLALVKRIIETHGGQVWVESEGENQGATFYFTIPTRSETIATAVPVDTPTESALS